MLLSLEQLKRRGIEIAGTVVNAENNAENREAIARYGKTPILAEVPHLARADVKILAVCFQQAFA